MKREVKKAIKVLKANASFVAETSDLKTLRVPDFYVGKKVLVVMISLEPSDAH